MVKLRREIRVASAQVSGGLLDLDLSVNRLLEVLPRAAEEGVQLVVFPETFLGGYPYWRGHVDVVEETELAARLHEHAVRTDSAIVAEIGSEAVRLGLTLIVGANEADTRMGSQTSYNSVFVFDPEVGFIGRRRKLIPTHTERAYWGNGTSEDVRIFDTSVGSIGALICYEHHMLPAQLALALLGEQIHCALWPGYWTTNSHIADKRPGLGTGDVEIDAIVRAYAMHSQNFVVSANAILRDGDIPDDIRPKLGYNLARGGSSIVDSSGRYLAPPLADEEGLVIAEIGFESRSLTKAYVDTVGHYARWDIFDFRISGQSLTSS